MCRTARFAHALPVPIEAPLPMPALTMNRSSPPSRVGQLRDDAGDRLGVVDVHRRHLHPDAGVGGEQFLLQRLEPVDAAGGEREVAAHGGEPAGHALAEAGAGAGDQDALTDGVRHRDSMPHPAAAGTLWPKALGRVSGGR